MGNDFTSAWLMYSIFHSGRDLTGANISDIIVVADYSNHAIITYDELSEGLNILHQLRLITFKDKHIIITELFKGWWTLKFANKKRQFVQKEISDIQRYISQLKLSISKTTFENLIPKSDYEKAIDNYLNRTNDNT